jgi:aquaporin Z
VERTFPLGDPLAAEIRAKQLRKCLVETVGTFFLVATIGFTVLRPNDAGAMAPLAIGSILMVTIFAGAHLSGAHYNPAVTLAVFVRGRCSGLDVVTYWLAQVFGGVVAAAIVLYMKDPSPGQALNPNIPRALLAEFLYTFALCAVVLNVATSKATNANSFYGLAVGFTVLTGAYSVGAISGGAFNPAVAVGITIMGLSAWTNIWIFLVANLAAGALAGVCFRVQNPDDP